MTEINRPYYTENPARISDFYKVIITRVKIEKFDDHEKLFIIWKAEKKYQI